MNCLLHLKKDICEICENWILQFLYSLSYMVCYCRFIKNTLGVCLYYSSNTILLVEALNFQVTYKDLNNKIVYDPLNREYMMHCCTNCPGMHYINFWKKSSVTMILIFNFISHNGKLQTELPW